MNQLDEVTGAVTTILVLGFMAALVKQLMPSESRHILPSPAVKPKNRYRGVIRYPEPDYSYMARHGAGQWEAFTWATSEAEAKRNFRYRYPGKDVVQVLPWPEDD